VVQYRVGTCIALASDLASVVEPDFADIAKALTALL